MDINLHNFGMEHPQPLKLRKWVIDVNNSFKCFCLFCFFLCFFFQPLVRPLDFILQHVKKGGAITCILQHVKKGGAITCILQHVKKGGAITCILQRG